MDLSVLGCLPWAAGDLTIEDVAGLLRRPAWHADGACLEHPEVTWFPGRGESGEPAKAVCRGCLARGDCQDWAGQQGPDLEGIWGGLSQGDRRRLRAAAAA